MLRVPVLLLVIVAVVAAAEPAAWARRGPHAVVSADLRLADPARDRAVPLRIHAPVALEGPLPVLVFSHGLGGDRFVYAYIGQHLASHGYLSIHPQHPGSDAEIGRAGLLAMAAAAADPAQWEARVADLELVLDRLPALEHPLLAGRVDSGAIAVGGHSFGAYAALVLGGQSLALPDRPERRRADPRLRAVVALSPLGPGILGLDATSWSALEVPTLFITGTQDTTIGTADWRSRLEPFRLAPAEPRYLAVITDLRHHAMGDYDFPHAPVLRDPRHHPWILALITAFLEDRLRADAAAGAWLGAGGPGALGGGELRFEAVTPP